MSKIISLTTQAAKLEAEIHTTARYIAEHKATWLQTTTALTTKVAAILDFCDAHPEIIADKQLQTTAMAHKASLQKVAAELKKISKTEIAMLTKKIHVEQESLTKLRDKLAAPHKDPMAGKELSATAERLEPLDDVIATALKSLHSIVEETTAVQAKLELAESKLEHSTIETDLAKIASRAKTIGKSLDKIASRQTPDANPSAFLPLRQALIDLETKLETLAISPEKPATDLDSPSKDDAVQPGF